MTLVAEELSVAAYPELPSVADLIANESSKAEAFPEMEDHGDPAKIAKAISSPAITEMLQTGSPDTPVDNFQLPTIDRQMPMTNPAEFTGSANPPPIAMIAEAVPPDLFILNQRFRWGKPYGQWMKQLLADIEKARIAGDLDAYAELTDRYTQWAEKYLRKETPPDLDGRPSH